MAALKIVAVGSEQHWTVVTSELTLLHFLTGLFGANSKSRPAGRNYDTLLSILPQISLVVTEPGWTFIAPSEDVSADWDYPLIFFAHASSASSKRVSCQTRSLDIWSNCSHAQKHRRSVHSAAATASLWECFCARATQAYWTGWGGGGCIRNVLGQHSDYFLNWSCTAWLAFFALNLVLARKLLHADLIKCSKN